MGRRSPTGQGGQGAGGNSRRLRVAAGRRSRMPSDVRAGWLWGGGRNGRRDVPLFRL